MPDFVANLRSLDFDDVSHHDTFLYVFNIYIYI